MAQVTILSGPERRRRWSDEPRERILAETLRPGARVCDVARRPDVARRMIHAWRRAPPSKVDPVFVSAVVMYEPLEQASGPLGAAVLDLPDCRRLSILHSASPVQTTPSPGRSGGRHQSTNRPLANLYVHDVCSHRDSEGRAMVHSETIILHDRTGAGCEQRRGSMSGGCPG